VTVAFRSVFSPSVGSRFVVDRRRDDAPAPAAARRLPPAAAAGPRRRERERVTFAPSSAFADDEPALKKMSVRNLIDV